MVPVNAMVVGQFPVYDGVVAVSTAVTAAAAGARSATTSVAMAMTAMQSVRFMRSPFRDPLLSIYLKYSTLSVGGSYHDLQVAVVNALRFSCCDLSTKP
jgi:hypothetical protein